MKSTIRNILPVTFLREFKIGTFRQVMGLRISVQNWTKMVLMGFNSNGVQKGYKKGVKRGSNGV